jgi:hypothetical protein
MDRFGTNFTGVIRSLYSRTSALPSESAVLPREDGQKADREVRLGSNSREVATSLVPARRLVPGHKSPSGIPQDIAAVFPQIVSTVTKYISLVRIFVD